MRRSHLLSAFCAWMLTAGLVTPANAALVDQQQATVASYSFSTDHYAQSFTPSYNNIVAVDLWFATAGDYTVTIRDIPGYPGAVIGSSGVQIMTAGENHIAFPSAIDLTPGELYSILVLDSTGCPTCGDHWVLGNAGSDLYAGGTAYGAYNGTINYPTWDWAFRTYAVPIPAAIWLFGSGLLGLIGISRRNKAA